MTASNIRSSEDFVARGLHEKGGPGETPKPRGCINRGQHIAVCRYVYTSAARTIPEQWHRQQGCPFGNGLLYNGKRHDGIKFTRHGGGDALKMYFERLTCIGQNILRTIRRGKTTWHIREPDPPSAVCLFVHKSDIMCHSSPSVSQPAPCAIWRATPGERSRFGCGTVKRAVPFVNWWCDPRTLRKTQPSALRRRITLRLLRSIHIYLHTTATRSKSP